jgi:hypothetical protein
MAHPEGYPPLKAKFEFVNSTGFIMLCMNAEDNNLNRQCETPLIEENIDPDGKHVLGLSFIHNDDHMRTQWLVKMKDEDEPVPLWLDVTFEALNFAKLLATQEAEA